MFHSQHLRPLNPKGVTSSRGVWAIHSCMSDKVTEQHWYRIPWQPHLMPGRVQEQPSTGAKVQS